MKRWTVSELTVYLNTIGLVHVYYNDDEGVRIFGTDYVILRSKCSDKDWEKFMDIMRIESEDK